MPYLELAVNFLTAALWPIVVLVLGLVYRDTMKSVLKRLTKLDAFGVTAELEKQLERLDETADRVVAESDASNDTKPASESPGVVRELPLRNLVEVARLSPSAAIVDAWREVESRLRGYFFAVRQVRDLPRTRGKEPAVHEMIRTLGEAEMISADQQNLLRELQMTRNSVAHGREEPSEGQSLSYVDAAALAVQTLASDKWAIEKGEH